MVKDGSFLHPLPPFSKAEEGEYHATESLSQLDYRLDNNDWSNYPIAMSALLKKKQLFGIPCLLRMQ